MECDYTNKTNRLYLEIGITLIEAPLRNPYLPIDAYPPREYKPWDLWNHKGTNIELVLSQMRLRVMFYGYKPFISSLF